MNLQSGPDKKPPTAPAAAASPESAELPPQLPAGSLELRMLEYLRNLDGILNQAAAQAERLRQQERALVDGMSKHYALYGLLLCRPPRDSSPIEILRHEGRIWRACTEFSDHFEKLQGRDQVIVQSNYPLREDIRNLTRSIGQFLELPEVLAMEPNWVLEDLAEAKKELELFQLQMDRVDFSPPEALRRLHERYKTSQSQ